MCGKRGNGKDLEQKGSQVERWNSEAGMEETEETDGGNGFMVITWVLGLGSWVLLLGMWECGSVGVWVGWWCGGVVVWWVVSLGVGDWRLEIGDSLYPDSL